MAYSSGSLLPVSITLLDPGNLGPAGAGEQRQMAGYRQAPASACIQPLGEGPPSAGTEVKSTEWLKSRACVG